MISGDDRHNPEPGGDSERHRPECGGHSDWRRDWSDSAEAAAANSRILFQGLARCVHRLLWAQTDLAEPEWFVGASPETASYRGARVDAGEDRRATVAAAEDVQSAGSGRAGVHCRHQLRRAAPAERRVSRPARRCSAPHRWASSGRFKMGCRGISTRSRRRRSWTAWLR